MGHSVRGRRARRTCARVLHSSDGVWATRTPAHLGRSRRLTAKVGSVDLARDAQAPQRHVRLVRLVRLALARSRARDGGVDAACVLVAGPHGSELLTEELKAGSSWRDRLPRVPNRTDSSTLAGDAPPHALSRGSRTQRSRPRRPDTLSIPGQHSLSLAPRSPVRLRSAM